MVRSPTRGFAAANHFFFCEKIARGGDVVLRWKGHRLVWHIESSHPFENYLQNRSKLMTNLWEILFMRWKAPSHDDRITGNARYEGTADVISILDQCQTSLLEIIFLKKYYIKFHVSFRNNRKRSAYDTKFCTRVSAIYAPNVTFDPVYRKIHKIRSIFFFFCKNRLIFQSFSQSRFFQRILYDCNY